MDKAIDYFSYYNKWLPVKTFFSLRARKKMYNLFIKTVDPSPEDEVLDLGTTPDEQLADSNIFDRLYPYKDHLSICSIEDCSDVCKRLGLKAFYRNEPKKRLPFEDGQFDVCLCSAVLEHVGSREDQEFFINECLRVARRVFLTTPYRYFPLEMHTFIPFLHWLPRPLFQRIVLRVCGSFWAQTDNLNLCSRKDILKMKLNRKVRIEFIRTALMRSNMIIHD